jgi:hypothetical protein
MGGWAGTWPLGTKGIARWDRGPHSRGEPLDPAISVEVAAESRGSPGEAGAAPLPIHPRLGPPAVLPWRKGGPS